MGCVCAQSMGRHDTKKEEDVKGRTMSTAELPPPKLDDSRW